MSIYDITYQDKVVELLPPDKRFVRMVAWLRGLVNQLQVLRDKIFGDYKQGITCNPWEDIVYNTGDLVKYGETVYISLIDSNTDVPTVTTSWAVYQNSFIGVDERVLFNHQKLVLEYALNKRFGTTFNQPPSTSTIYITTNTNGNNVFIVGATEDESSLVYLDGSTETVVNSYSFSTFYNFTVYVPTAVFNAVAGTTAERNAVFSNFINRYNTVGLTYNITTY